MNPDGSVKEKARVTVELNGIKVQDNVPIEGSDGRPRARQAAGERRHRPAAVAGPRQPRPLPQCLVGRTQGRTAVSL